jgi:hypothetical protein
MVESSVLGGSELDGSLLPPPLQRWTQLADRVVEAPCHSRPGGLRLDQAEPRQVRLGGEEGQHLAGCGDRLMGQSGADSTASATRSWMCEPDQV